jgi:hypothetical protein
LEINYNIKSNASTLKEDDHNLASELVRCYFLFEIFLGVLVF